MLLNQSRLEKNEEHDMIGESAAEVAHELRNSLTSVYLALHNLRRDISIPEQIGRIDMIRDELMRATGQLNNILDHSKERNDKLVLIDVKDEVQSIVSLASYQLNEHILIDYSVENNLTCLLPGLRLRQALLNIVLNSGQVLGNKAGAILIVVEKKRNILFFKISDSGPGFPNEILKAGINTFCSWRPGGTGLGLAMVSKFVNDFGGKISLDNCSKLGGARVIIKLPFVNKND